MNIIFWIIEMSIIKVLKIPNRIPDMPLSKPKPNFYNTVVPKSTAVIQRTWAQDKLDLFKKDQASNFLYPKRFAYADTDAVSWKTHITKDFEEKLPDYYGVGTIRRAKE